MYNPSEFCLTSVTCIFMCQEHDWTIHENKKNCAINRLLFNIPAERGFVINKMKDFNQMQMGLYLTCLI